MESLPQEVMPRVLVKSASSENAKEYALASCIFQALDIPSKSAWTFSASCAICAVWPAAGQQIILKQQIGILICISWCACGFFHFNKSHLYFFADISLSGSQNKLHTVFIIQLFKYFFVIGGFCQASHARALVRLHSEQIRPGNYIIHSKSAPDLS